MSASDRLLSKHAMLQQTHIPSFGVMIHYSSHMGGRQITDTDNRTKVSSAAKSERNLLHDWLRAAAVLQSCSDQWPQPSPGNIKPEPEPGGGWRGQPPARAIRSQLRSLGNSQERGHRGSWHPHPMSWRMPSLWLSWVYCERDQHMSQSYATNKNKEFWVILMGTITNTLKTTLCVENWTNILTVSIINLNGILKLECDQSLNWCSNGTNV